MLIESTCPYEETIITLMFVQESLPWISFDASANIAPHNTDDHDEQTKHYPYADNYSDIHGNPSHPGLWKYK